MEFKKLDAEKIDLIVSSYETAIKEIQTLFGKTDDPCELKRIHWQIDKLREMQVSLLLSNLN